MLSAQTKAGKKVNLGYPYKKETLEYLRKREEFFCPICGERVYLKLGTVKIFHFAHKSGGTCREFYEPETEYHMEGKLQLYHWLKKQRVDAVLEYYDKDIKQRPDIAFVVDGQKYALEYQCSSLSEQTFKKRTDNYLRNGYVPVWILGNGRLEEKRPGSTSLTSFHYLFLRENLDHQMYLPFFSPEQNRFHILSSIFPYTTKYALVQKMELPLQQVNLSSFLNPMIVTRVDANLWRMRMDKNQWNWSMYPAREQKYFFSVLYQKGLNPYLLPFEIGLPVAHGLLIQTPPFVWQAYLYLDVILPKRPGEIISPKEISYRMGKRIAAGKIQLRKTPQLKEGYAFDAATDYLRALEKLGITHSLSGGYFQIQKLITIPKTNREKEEIDAKFLNSKWWKQVIQ